MTTALELRGIRKCFVAGAGNCRASAHVLRGVDLVLRTGECVAVVGAPGAGKSTLMLCAAGLMTPDVGDRRWFGDASRAIAVRRTLYHANASDLTREGSAGEAHVHLVDVPVVGDAELALERWIHQRCERGDAVLAIARDESTARRIASRAYLLRMGQLQILAPTHARVAEFVDRSFQRV